MRKGGCKGKKQGPSAKERSLKKKLEAARSALNVVLKWTEFNWAWLDAGRVAALCRKTLKETEAENP